MENTLGVFGVDPKAEYRYIPIEARSLPLEDQPVFLLCVMSARDSAKLQDNSVSVMPDNSVNVRSGSVILGALENGVKGWENFKFSNGELVPFRENAGKPRPDTFDYLTASLRKELADVITDGVNLSEQVEKNSASQSADS